MTFKTRRSVFVVWALLHETDLNEARQSNQKLALNGGEARKNLMMSRNRHSCLTLETSVVKLEKIH